MRLSGRAKFRESLLPVFRGREEAFLSSLIDGLARRSAAGLDGSRDAMYRIWRDIGPRLMCSG